MKAAVLISGYLRSLELNLDNIIEKILNKFDYYDVYIHITIDEFSEDKYFNPYSDNLINEIIEKLNPKTVILEPNLKVYNDDNKNTIFNQWIKQYKLNELKKINEKIYGQYDIVVKIRPDVYLKSDIPFESTNNEAQIFLPLDSKIDKTKLENPNDNHFCDTIAFGNSKSMDLYFELVLSLDELFEEYGNVPETVIFGYLKNRIKVSKFDLDYIILLSSCNVFAICGDSGSGKSTLGELLKKYFKSSFLLECDRYHKWERYDPNWQNFTHLNPDANFLTKMRQDIFDLKIGESIYQVDYDHKTGKFTQKEKIENSENLIVCGLHSLYGDTSNIYDLKIFMDTEDNLKRKWKIERDVNKRGYNVEKVIEQIENRQSDYKLFIEPQKENSNVIINFYSEEPETNYEKLRIYISNKLDMKKIISIFLNANINFSVDVGDKFTIIDFKKYVDHESFNRLEFKTFNFYDYIIMIILNLHK